MNKNFDDLIAANRHYVENFHLAGFDGIARAGVAIVTCMDSRIDPLGIWGLKPGDAKMFRNPGGRVTEAALEALVLGVHLLNVNRIIVMPHTRCAMTTSTEAQLQKTIGDKVGHDATWHAFSVVDDQQAALITDVRKVHSHPLIPDSVQVGGFIYNVDTGLTEPVISADEL